jgi:hypothetical protein
MSHPTDRHRPQPSTEPEARPLTPGLISGEEVPPPGVSPEEAAAYIGDMAGSLGRIARASGLTDIARLLAEVDAEARRFLDGRDRGRGPAKQGRPAGRGDG